LILVKKILQPICFEKLIQWHHGGLDPGRSSHYNPNPDKPEPRRLFGVGVGIGIGIEIKIG